MSIQPWQKWQQHKGFSDSELARQLEVHPSLISHIKAGRRKWSPKMAEAMEILSGGQLHRFDLLYPNSTKPQVKNKIPNWLLKLFLSVKILTPK